MSIIRVSKYFRLLYDEPSNNKYILQNKPYSFVKAFKTKSEAIRVYEELVRLSRGSKKPEIKWN